VAMFYFATDYPWHVHILQQTIRQGWPMPSYMHSQCSLQISTYWQSHFAPVLPEINMVDIVNKHMMVPRWINLRIAHLRVLTGGWNLTCRCSGTLGVTDRSA